MRYERNRDEIWVYSGKGVMQLSIKNEDKDAWKLYMEKKKYKEAYEICKKYNSSYTNYVGGLLADEMLETKKYDEAAKLYVDTSRNFEEISLKFLMGRSLDGFESIGGLNNLFKFHEILAYLENWLKKLKADDKPQRTLLLTLMTELKLYKQNKIENSADFKASDELSRFARDALKYYSFFIIFYFNFLLYI